MNINDFFDDIYCINLEERKDRWKTAVEALKQLGITSLKRYPAIKHQQGAVGCRMSHVDIITRAKQEKRRNILIFEDDIEVLPGEDNQISHALDELNDLDWDMFYFGATIAPGSKVTPVTNNIAHTNFAYTTHAYALNGRIFDYVLESVKNFQVIDVFYNQVVVSRGKTFIIHPIRVVQQEGYSDIEGKHTKYADDMINFYKGALTND